MIELANLVEAGLGIVELYNANFVRVVLSKRAECKTEFIFVVQGRKWAGFEWQQRVGCALVCAMEEG